MKCGKDVGLWRLVLRFFPFIAVILDTDVAILGIENRQLAGLVPDFTTLVPILSAWGNPGGLWEQQKGHLGSGDGFLLIWDRFRDSLSKASFSRVETEKHEFKWRGCHW